MKIFDKQYFSSPAKSFRSRGQENSAFSSRWSAGKALLFSVPSASRSFLAPRRAYGLNAFQQAFCLYSGKCEPCSMPQSRVRTIGLAVEGLWRLRAGGGLGYSTLINLPPPPGRHCDGLSGMQLGTFPNTLKYLMLICIQ